ncbi:MAG: DUF4832 domain-containing protein [Candidatus Zixiibacteriota bacterium]
MKNKSILLLSFIFLLLNIFPGVVEAQETVRILPERTDELLINPGKGIATFQHFNGDPLFPDRWSEQGPLTFNKEISSLENKDYPQTSLSYCRWYWDVLEPVKGQYAWDIIDNSLLQAHRHGQTLQIRMMPQSHRGTQIPNWYMEEAKGFLMEEFDEEVWQPDYRDPKFVEYWGELIRAFGQRYDGHPWLESVDLAALGYWGEWHTWTRPGMMPPWEIKKQLIDIYLESFQKTPLLMLIGDEQGLTYAVQRGAGWRADSLGDPMYCEPWCEMNDRYPMRISGTGATDAWKTAPVVFEVGRTFARHLESGWDIDNTIAEALRWHVSSVNAKSSAIPAGWMPKFEEFIKRMGYRFELRKMEYPAKVRAGSMMPIQMWWVNGGVAPIYRRHDLVLQLWNQETSGMITIDTDITKWLPGDDIVIEDRFCVPNLAPGTYRVRIGLLDLYSGRPAIKFPLKGRTDDNWHDLGEIQIEKWDLQ